MQTTDSGDQPQSRERQRADPVAVLFPLAYFLTFTCYGTRLHGDQRGSVDRLHNQYETPDLAPSPLRVQLDWTLMKQRPYSLDPKHRALVLEAIRTICGEKHWKTLAAPVRSTHVHCVIEAESPPEAVLNALKSCASRRLNQSGLDAPGRKQGAPMELFVADS